MLKVFSKLKLGGRDSGSIMASKFFRMIEPSNFPDFRNNRGCDFFTDTGDGLDNLIFFNILC